jgi:hypothetical protein
MHMGYDDFDEFEFDDNEVVRRVLREQAREEIRWANRRRKGLADNNRSGHYDYDDSSFKDDLDDDYEEYGDYEDYDEDEFDNASGVSDWR